MDTYPIKIVKKDFRFIEVNLNIKGSRAKRITIDNNKKIAIFKYEMKDYQVSEIASEKMCEQIAQTLGYKCAKIEFAKDEYHKIGILNYLFVNLNQEEHIDAISYLNTKNKERKDFYTIQNIKKTLDELNKNLFKDFLKIVVFDSLVGEQDRHEENWGLTKLATGYKISPLYDNGCNLLREFKNEEFASKFYNKEKDFLSYIKKSRTIIYKEDHKTRYKHFELIEDLYKLFKEDMTKEISNLKKLTDEKIEDIVMYIPDELLTRKHKEYIIMYLKIRKQILLNIIEGEKK